ncbi:phage tail protein [Cellulomonas humilata]|uniref:Phage tail-like protein n=1 Tax=Cellulomonas humilata TaxID=144055 RepID=A0ABU0EG99_9CELL|nr:phage tail protein [Cellulomonas humilata]MDQ0373837.1 phage tail-like protein [Cellulomonas humilata]
MSQTTEGTTPAAAASGTATWTDPFRAHNFKLMIQGVTEGHFIECSGLDITIDVDEYREAGQSQVVHKVPTITRYGDVSLRYGLTNRDELWKWFEETVRGEIKRRNVTIVLLDAQGTQPVIQWNLRDALPVRWKGATLRATAREVAIEEIVLSYETLARGA